MSEQINQSVPPVLEEYHFQSQVPVLGSVIAWLRNAAYGIAARWGVQHVIVQQNHINAQLLERIQELEARLIDQDRDLARLARITAEIDLRQRYLMKTQAQSERAD